MRRPGAGDWAGDFPRGDDLQRPVVTVTDETTTAPALDSRKIGELARRGDLDVRSREAVFRIDGSPSRYAGALALEGATLDVHKNAVTAFIGPSGCGKSTFIRCLNRMNDLIPGATVDGPDPLPRPRPLRAPRSTRSRCGAGSAWCSRSRTRSRSRSTTTSRSARACSGMKKDLDERVEQALVQAALWDEVKDRLKDNALGLSGGQQQRLCIARALAVEPDVILMDEPASALDPISTTRIEDLIHELKRDYTIAIVTHNMQQAARVADMTAFFSVEIARRRQGPTRHPRRVRPDDEDLHEPRRQAHRGLRHGAVRMRAELQSDLDALEASFQETGEIVLRAIRGARRRAAHTGRRALRRGHRVRRRDRRPLHGDREPDPARARASDARCHRPPARARAPPLDDPRRAHGRPVRDDRQADEALEPPRTRSEL